MIPRWDELPETSKDTITTIIESYTIEECDFDTVNGVPCIGTGLATMMAIEIYTAIRALTK